MPVAYSRPPSTHSNLYLMRQIQRDLHQQLRAESVATREKLLAMLRPVDAAKLNEHPEPNGWSVGQVCEHLVKADELIDDSYAELMRGARPDASAATREWKSTLIGGLIAESLINPKQLNRPKVFEPGPTPRNGVVETLLSRELRFVAAMDDALVYDWRALKIRSPALFTWMPKINLGDAFRIHVVHVTRHSKQIARLNGSR